MERRLILVVLLFAVFEIHCQAPTAGSRLEAGVTYSFAYNTTVLLSELDQGTSASAAAVKDVGYQILADTECTVIWQHPQDREQQLLLITVRRPRLFVRSRRAPAPDGFAPHTSELDGWRPVSVLLLPAAGGRQTRLWRQTDATETQTSLARGLVGLITIRPDGQYRETDASGTCDVTYTSLGGGRLLKTKERCDEAAPIRAASHPVLDVSVTSSRRTEYVLSAAGGPPELVTSQERHQLSPQAGAGYGTGLTAAQTLQLSGSRRSEVSPVSASSVQEALSLLSAPLGWTPVKADLPGPAEPQGCLADGDCPKLSELAARLTQSSVATLEAARALVALVPALREATEDEVAQLLKQHTNSPGMPALLEAAAAAQTVAVHRAVRRALSWQPEEERDVDRLERYLTALSVAAQPPAQLVTDVVKESRRSHKSEQLQETLMLTAAALAATHCSTTGSTQVCSDLASHLVSSLQACPPDSLERCCLTHLPALANLGSEAALPGLVSLVTESESALCRRESLAVLAVLPAASTASLRPMLQRLFADPDRYDASSRAAAAELLLAAPQPSDADLLLSNLADRNQTELNSYVMHLLRTAASRHRLPLPGQLVHNYDLASRGALSAALERSVLSGPAGQLGFSSSLEMSAAGRALKRSQFSAHVTAAGRRLNLLTFGLQAAGLSGLVGSPDADDEAEDAQARLQLSLLGRRLRSRQLFSGQAELMSLLWTGAGSERTPALQDTVVVCDHLQRIPLQSGLTAQLSLLAAVSLELAGSAEVSLWSRTARGQVDARAALLLRSAASADLTFVRAQMTSSLAAEARLDAATDAQFSDGARTCARISQEPLSVRQTVRKQERVPGSRHRLRRVRRRRLAWPGRTFGLGQKNADTCRQMDS